MIPGNEKRRWFSILLDNRGFAKVADDDDDNDPEVVFDDDEPSDDEGLEVDLDEPSDDEGLEVDLDEDEDDEDDDPKAKSKQNKKFAQMRVKNKELAEENERLKRGQATVPSRPQQPAAQPQGAQANPNDPRNWSEAQWDKYAKEDWKGAVDLRSQINAENVINNTTKAQKDNSIMEESKEIVAAKHPELNLDNTPKSKIYIEILNENPRYLTDPKGPIHAMRDMEDRMRERGYPEEEIVAAEKRGASRERSRQSRVTLTSQKGRHVSESERKVQLTKDEVEFCKFNGIDTKEYAKNKLKMSKKGRVQV